MTKERGEERKGKGGFGGGGMLSNIVLYCTTAMSKHTSCHASRSQHQGSRTADKRQRRCRLQRKGKTGHIDILATSNVVEVEVKGCLGVVG